MSSKSLILEGKNDYYTLKYVLESGYSSRDISCGIAAGFGKDTLDCLIALYIGWSTDFIVLLDDDGGGRETYKRLQDKFGSVLEGKLFRLSHVDKRFKSKEMEGVFTIPDQIKIIKSVFPDVKTFDKVKFNLALQDNYFNKSVVEISKNTKDRFSVLIDFIESKFNS